MVTRVSVRLRVRISDNGMEWSRIPLTLTLTLTITLIPLLTLVVYIKQVRTQPEEATAGDEFYAYGQGGWEEEGFGQGGWEEEGFVGDFNESFDRWRKAERKVAKQ